MQAAGVVQNTACEAVGRRWPSVKRQRVTIGIDARTTFEIVPNFGCVIQFPLSRMWGFDGGK